MLGKPGNIFRTSCPHFWSNVFFKKEVEKKRTSKRVHVNPGKHVSPRDARSGTRMGASIPLEMESKGDGTFEFLMQSEESVERLLTYNYQELEKS